MLNHLKKVMMQYFVVVSAAPVSRRKCHVDELSPAKKVMIHEGDFSVRLLYPHASSRGGVVSSLKRNLHQQENHRFSS